MEASIDKPKRSGPRHRVRLEDVAARCGVSVSTASRAMAGGKGVRADLREKIIATAKSLNYVDPDLDRRPQGDPCGEQRGDGRLCPQPVHLPRA